MDVPERCEHGRQHFGADDFAGRQAHGALFVVAFACGGAFDGGDAGCHGLGIG